MKVKNYCIMLVLSVFGIASALAQEQTISGTINDEYGVPLPGVNVVVQNTTRGVQTDFDGNYTLDVNQGEILVYSFVGYVTKEVTVEPNANYNFALEPDVESLGEVVVTALGIQRKADELTSSNQVVKTDELTRAQTNDVVQSLAGKVSGLQINTTTTGVNPNTDIILRGYGSITGGNEALIVIDNVISTTAVLNTLDPNTIANVNVMKGPAGAALYGVKGGNGVIIVTTKKGTKDNAKFSVSLNSTVTVEDIAYLPQRQDRFGQGWEGDFDWTDQGAWGPEFDGSLQVVGIPYPTANDWRFSTYEHIEDNIKPFFNTGFTYLNSLSLASGSSEGYTNLSINRRDTDGIVPEDSYTKNYLSLNTGKRLGKIRVAGIARYITEKTDRTATGMYANLNQTPTNVNVEMFNSGNIIDHWTLYANNPYWLINNNRQATRINTFEVQGEIQYFINDNINVLLRSSANFTDLDRLVYTNEDGTDITILGTPQGIASTYDKLKRTNRSFYTDLIASFDYDLSENISLSAHAGLNSTQNRIDLSSLGGNDLLIPGLYSIDNVPGTPRTVQDHEDRNFFGIYADAQLAYKKYLFLNVTGRNDRDSALNEDNRSFFYYSFGGSLVLTKAFPKIKNKFLHKAKVSANYIKTGNANGVNAYDINSIAVQAAGYPYTSTGLNSFINALNGTDFDIKNEEVFTTEINLNLDLLKLNGVPRINLDASYSFQTNENQILNTVSSSTSGLTTTTLNVGETETKAFEVDLGFTPIKTDNFEWNASVGLSTYKTIVNKVTDNSKEVITNFYANAAGNQVGTVGLFAIEGEEYPLIRGTAYTRDELGRVVIDSNGNPVISSDLKTLGKVTPDYILNFRTGVRYKNFSFNAVVDYRTGHSFNSAIANNLNQVGGTVESAQNGRQPFLFPNSTVQGTGVTNTTVLTGGNSPAAFQSYIQDNYEYFDENFVLDATAIKIREVSLNYDMPEKVLEKLPFKSLRLGVSGRNLYTFLPRENRGYNDPEVGTGLGNYSQTPPTRLYSFSVNLTF